jgi:uncharacterized membrane protein
MQKIGRLESIDVVRGGVMVLMALDHVRDYVTQLRFPPENLARGSAALFATRWVTHFCAPAFFLLAGLGIGISMERGRSPGEMSRYLITRGLWLVVLELTFTSIGWRFGFDLVPLFGIVLWALGWSMVLMAGLVHLPRTVVAAIAALAIVGHNLLDGIRPASLGAFAWLWHVLHVPGFAIPGKLLIAYPIVPWFAVMALGYVLAGAYAWPAERRRRVFVAGGVVAALAFVLLRWMNEYGEPRAWATQRSVGLTVSSFLNVTKYPPSLQFLLMTLGPVIATLALAERWGGALARWLSVYGRVPLFYYTVHIFLAHAAGVAIAWFQGFGLRRIPVVHDPGSVPDAFGVGLPGVYIAWIVVVLLMYWPCRWYARLKERRDDWWLRYT